MRILEKLKEKVINILDLDYFYDETNQTTIARVGDGTNKNVIVIDTLCTIDQKTFKRADQSKWWFEYYDSGVWYNADKFARISLFKP